MQIPEVHLFALVIKAILEMALFALVRLPSLNHLLFIEILPGFIAISFNYVN